MTVTELGQKLEKMCQDAPKNERVVNIYKFGVKYATEIKELGRSGIKDVIQQSRLPSTYKTELSKAVKLSKYVTLK